MSMLGARDITPYRELSEGLEPFGRLTMSMGISNLEHALLKVLSLIMIIVTRVVSNAVWMKGAAAKRQGYSETDFELSVDVKVLI